MGQWRRFTVITWSDSNCNAPAHSQRRRVCTRGLSGGRIAGDAHIGQFCVGSVDRRFNRARYEADAARTAVAAGLEDVEDLDSIRDDLAPLARQAREPAHADMDQPAAEAHLCHFATTVEP